MSYLRDYLKTIEAETKEENSQKMADLVELEQRLKEPFREAIKNIMTSNELRVAINKACNNGKPALEVLDLALQAIAAMTGDKRFYEVNIKKMKEANK